MSSFGFFIPICSLFPSAMWEQNRPLPEGQSNYTLTQRVIGIAWDLFRSLPVYIGSTGVVSFFVNPSERKYVVLLAAGGFLLQSIFLTISHAIQAEHERADKNVGTFLQYAEHIACLIAQAATSVFYQMTILRVFHQMGHAISALALFKNPSVVIDIGLGYGKTLVKPEALSELGERLGWKRSLATLAVSGSLLGLIHDLALLTFAHFSKDEDFSMQGHVTVGLHSISTAYYALSALWNVEIRGHDFVQLRNLAGIDPVASALFFLIVPTLWKGILVAYDQLNERLSVRAIDVLSGRTDHPVLSFPVVNIN